MAAQWPPNQQLDQAEIGMAKVLDMCGLQRLLEQQLDRAGDHTPFALHLVNMHPATQTPFPVGLSSCEGQVNEIVTCLNSLVSPEDVIAKINNRRVAVLQRKHLSHSGAASLAAEMRAKLSSPANAEWLNMHCSVGTVELAEAAESPGSLMRLAEQALAGTNPDGACIYTSYRCPRLIAEREEIAVASTLLEALENEQFELYYQPILMSKTMKVAQLEALIRWRHPTQCYLMPNHFIPAAERTGVIVNIGRWALERACRETLSRSSTLEVAVNISAVEFMTSDVSRSIENALEETGLYPRRLTIELTETVLLSNWKHLLWQLERIRDMGVKISVDDFGSGYSSLAYVHSLPIESIKLDRSFIHSMKSSERSMHVVDGVLKIARDLKLSTVAEGIESKCEADVMRKKGVTYMQGYYFGRPAPPSEAFATLDAAQTTMQ